MCVGLSVSVGACVKSVVCIGVVVNVGVIVVGARLGVGVDNIVDGVSIAMI